jgi:hypothetical protein
LAVLCLYDLGRQRAAAHVGLVGDHHEDVSRLGEGATSRGGIREELERGEASRRLGQPGRDHRDIERAVPIEEYGGSER